MGTLTSRNFWLRPWNQPSQYFSDLDRSMRQVYFLTLAAAVEAAGTGVGTAGGGSSASSAMAFGLLNLAGSSVDSSGRGSSLVESLPVSMLE